MSKPLADGDAITLAPGTLFTVVDKNKDDGTILVEFEHDGNVYRVWAPETDFEKTVKH